MIGLGLYDEKDITVRGLECVKAASKVYLEMYTAILMVSKDRLEAFFGKPVIEADREFVERGCQEMPRALTTSFSLSTVSVTNTLSAVTIGPE